jgi:multidrug efflux pump subunit AcrB
MTGLTRFSLANSRLIIAGTILVVLTGIFTFLGFPAQEDPPIQVREAIVTAYFPGMSPGRVEELIAKPLENKIREMPEVQRITSSSFTGGVMISVKLYDRIFNLAPYWQQLRNLMADMRGSLPAGTIGPSVNDNFGDVAVATIALTAPGFTMEEMADITRNVRDQLRTVGGVRRIDLHGLQPQRVYMEASVAKLAQLRISLAAILTAMQAQNVILPGGQIEADGVLVTLEPTGNFTSLADIESTPLLIPSSGQTIALGDIFTVRAGYAEPMSSAAFMNNKQATVLAVSMAQGENIIDFGRRIRARMAEIETTLPIGFVVDYATFQPDVVSHSIGEVERTLYETLVIVLVVVMVFLGIRTGLIVGTIVPLTMLASLIIMNMVGIELQRVSIASLIIALGLLVDNGIVIAEDISRRLALGEERKHACIEAGRTLSLPLLTSSLTIILAFAPLLLADDQTGEYVRSLAQVIAITLLSSWVLCLTVTPLLCFYFLKAEASGHHDPDSDHHYDTRFYRIYRGILGGLLRNRLLFMAGIIIAFVLAVQAFSLVPQQFFPNSERNQFMIVVNLPAGTPIDRTQDSVRRIGDWLLDKNANPEVTSIVSYVGYGGPRIVLAMAPVSGAAQRGFILVNVPVKTDLDPIVARTRSHLLDEFPELTGEVKKFWLGGTETGLVELRVVGQNADVMKNIAERVKAILRSSLGTVDVKDDWENRTLKMVINVDQTRASRVGITSADIAVSLNAALSGTQISTLRESDQAIPIVLKGAPDEQLTIDRLRSLTVFSADGKRAVPLLEVAEFAGIPEDAVIIRRNQARTITVSGKSTEMSSGQLLRSIRPKLAEIPLPEGYRINVGGEQEASGNAQGALLKFMPVCFGAMMLLMVWQFGSFRKVLVIALTIPLCLIGAVSGLLISQATFGFMAIMGLLSLAGIIINNAILLLDRIHEELISGKTQYDAIISAAQKRLRPIVMTKLTCILGLVPMMIFGGELWYGMTVVIMGGLALGTLLTLGVIPVLYSLLFRVRPPAKLAEAAGPDVAMAPAPAQ